MSIIGLTGPTGAGKSEASKSAANFGFLVIDCDKVARDAVLPESKGLEALKEVFGQDIISSNGTLDRKRLAKIAFSTPQNTELLNKTLLPIIVDMIKPLLESGNVLLDAPTLFESGLDSVCDTTVAVLAEQGVRIERIIRRDMLTIDEAKLRISAGKPDDFYIQKAEHILYNNDTSDRFFKEAEELWRSLV